MKKQDNLFTLIKTMSRGEKRAFKLYATKYGKSENNSVALFDFFSKMSKYDKNRISDKFIVPNKIGKQFPVIKNQLFYLILNSLREQSAEKESPLRLYQFLGNAEVLLSRGLFEVSLKQLLKAEAICRLIEDFPTLLKVLDKKNVLYRRLLGVEGLSVKVKELKKEKDDIKYKITYENLFEELYLDLFLLYREKGVIDSDVLSSAYKSLGEKCDTLAPFKELTIKTRQYYYNFKTIFHFAFSDYEKSSESAIEHLGVFEMSPAFMQVSINEYLKALNNAIVINVNLAKYKEAESLIGKVELVVDKVESMNNFLYQRLFEIKYSNLLSIYVEANDIDKGLSLEIDIRDGLKKYRNAGMSIDRHIRLCFGLALLYFKKKDWNKCLDWMDEIMEIELEVSGSPSYMIGYSKLLICLCHYKLDNYALLESLTRGTMRFLKKRDRLFSVENIMLKFFDRVSKKNISEREKYIDKFLTEFESLTTDEKNKGFNKIIEINEWL